jgi:hypothetical protein
LDHPWVEDVTGKSCSSWMKRTVTWIKMNNV